MAPSRSFRAEDAPSSTRSNEETAATLPLVRRPRAFVLPSLYSGDPNYDTLKHKLKSAHSQEAGTLPAAR
jgi:hypothetical protein